MEMTVRVTKDELAEMEVTQEQFQQGIVQALDGGIEIESGGKVYLAGFNVQVRVLD